MTTLTLYFDTRDFQRSHGKAPRGHGRWAFAERLPNGTGPEYFAPHSMTLTEAKRWFKDHLLSLGVSGEFDIIVCP